MPKCVDCDAACGTAGTSNLMGLGFLATAVVLPYWVTDGDGHIGTGLWQDCGVFPEDCEGPFRIQDISNDPVWLNVVRALFVLALLFSFIAFLGYIFICFCDARIRILCMQVICNTLSMFLAIAGIVYYNLSIKEFDLDWGISQYFAIVAAVNFFGAALGSAVERCRGQPGIS